MSRRNLIALLGLLAFWGSIGLALWMMRGAIGGPS